MTDRPADFSATGLPYAGMVCRVASLLMGTGLLELLLRSRWAGLDPNLPSYARPDSNFLIFMCLTLLFSLRPSSQNSATVFVFSVLLWIALAGPQGLIKTLALGTALGAYWLMAAWAANLPPKAHMPWSDVGRLAMVLAAFTGSVLVGGGIIAMASQMAVTWPYVAVLAVAGLVALVLIAAKLTWNPHFEE